METMVSSATKEVTIGGGHPVRIIGERINPTGRKKFQEELKEGIFNTVRHQAMAQTEAGADILDVNIGTFGVDEVKILPAVVQIIMAEVDTPLCLDSSNQGALAAALKIYKGKALINSVSGEEYSMSKVLPMVKEYGAAVIGLVQDDRGVPDSWERRVEIANKIVEKSTAMGIPKEDILIDILALSVGADDSCGPNVLEAIRRIKAELGVNIALATSNSSFGLPDRWVINNCFATLAIQNGVTCLITDAEKARPVIFATELLLGRDKYCRRYLAGFREWVKRKQQ
jgi:5-methyltetrahydrofolate--homocysteine methyltransferase